MRILLAPALIALLAGCSEDTLDLMAGRSDAGVGDLDARSGADAAPAHDAGVVVDAGPLDAGADGGACAAPPLVDGPLCSAGGWCWASAYPQGNDLRDLAVVAADDLWAVGSGGTILRSNGVRWGRMDSPTTADLNGILVLSCSDAWAVGAEGTVLHYDGARWAQVDSGTTELLSGVYGVAPEEIFVFGTSGVRRWDGRSWTQSLSLGGSPEGMRRGWGRSRDDLWAMGTHVVPNVSINAALARWNGAEWSTVLDTPIGHMGAAWGEAGSGIWFAGGLVAHGGSAEATLFHWDGQVLSPPIFPPNTSTLRAIAGREDGLWAASDSALLHREGTTWRLVANQGAEAMGAAQGHLWAVGRGGRVLHAGPADTVPTALPGLEAGQLRGLWGPADDDLYAVGGGGIHHFDGRRWSVSSTAASSLEAIAGTGTTGYALGRGVFRREGSRWVVMPGSPGGGAIWAAPSGELFVVRRNRELWGFDGASWTMHGEYPGMYLTAVWGSSARDVWVVGAAGSSADPAALLHYDGMTWSVVAAPPGVLGTLSSVNGAGPADVWAVGEDKALHYDGQAWSAVAVPAGAYLSAVFTAPGQPVRVSGEGGQLLRWDGGGWVEELTGCAARLQGGLVTPTGTAWAYGSGGQVLRKQ